ncbi:MAG: response regulator [Nocardioidaceae bacterium]
MVEGRAIYAVAAVERILGESADTIHAWEERYGLPTPSRSPGGQLLYTRDDVERLRWIVHELAFGREPGAGAGDTAALTHAPEDEGGPEILVLLAERDPRAADLEEYFLRTEGYHVEVCGSAQEAEAGALALRPDVAVVELTLSGHAGLDLCRRLHEQSGTAVVAISSLDSRDQALAAGAEAFLLKPLDPFALISTIKDLLGASAFLHAQDGEPDAAT